VSHAHLFLGRDEELKAMSWQEAKRRQSFDFAWSITCHSAQGSQWDRVVVIDESRVFRKDARKWLYTSVTRAAKELVLVTTQ